MTTERTLTPQERRILDLLAEGLSNRDIAHKLGLQDKTVRNNVSSILAKLHVQSRTQAALRWVAREGGALE